MSLEKPPKLLKHLQNCRPPKTKSCVKSDKVLINFFLLRIIGFFSTPLPPKRIRNSIFLFYFWPKCEILPTKNKPCFTLLKCCTFIQSIYSFLQPVKMLQSTLDYNAYLYPSRATAKVIPWICCVVSTLWSWNQIEDQVHFMFKLETYRGTGGFRTSSSMVHLGLSH
jgi:hypothetical protein